MLIIISPAKTLDFKTPSPISKYSIPEMLDESKKLTGKLRELSAEEISELMGISSSLAYLNYERFQTWHTPFTPENAKQAVFAFNGDVYAGLDANSMTEGQLGKAQKKLRILSGLYGVLKPLDLIQPYRLEMGTKFRYEEAKDLYSFWKKKVTKKASFLLVTIEACRIKSTRFVQKPHKNEEVLESRVRLAGTFFNERITYGPGYSQAET